jgi:magnesium transporter
MADATQIRAELARRGSREGVELLAKESDETIESVLADMNPNLAVGLLWGLPDERRESVLAFAPVEKREQWLRNHEYPEDTVGRLMDPPIAIFHPDDTVSEVIAKLREIVKRAFVTYGYVVDSADKLVGVIVFRELLFADANDRVEKIMLRDPYSLRPETPLLDAMKDVVRRHFPVYPVSDASGRLVGIVRGQTLFEQQAIEISAQAGSMVGVGKEERLSTPWQRSLLFRHPWLQFNLLTAFVAAAVVGVFEATIERIVVLAVFLPVLAGQSGNTGCQALAVTLRGMTLGELTPNRASALVAKEAWLGMLNGLGTGTSAGLGMFAYAYIKGDPNAFLLALCVLIAMVGACVSSGLSGALVPMTLRRLGADPATASSIFLTTATDVASMGMFLGLATMLIP